MTKLTIAYTPEYLDWQLGRRHPSNPIRAALSVEYLLNMLPQKQVEVIRPQFHPRALKRLASQVHDRLYVTDALAGWSEEWRGHNPRLGRTAGLMFQGTVDLVDRMLLFPNQPRAVYFNPQGAKHHAQRQFSSGFCVLNDAAWAARTLQRAGRRPFYLDWDVHHGDGVENLLRDTDVPTASIHGSGFPGTGQNGHDTRNRAFNWLLPDHSTDADLLIAVYEALQLATRYRADTIILAAGADGLKNDPLGLLDYSLQGIELAAQAVGTWAAQHDADVLIGGAGGYQPLSETPEAWALTVAAIHEAVTAGKDGKERILTP